jgi:hypothetical protein
VRWVKIASTLPEHPKIASAGAKDALRLLAWHVAGICFSDRLGTDGQITAADLPNLIPAAGVPTARDLQLLVAHGLWDCRASGSYVVHNYHLYNESAADKRKSRDASSQRMRDFRARVAAQRDVALHRQIRTDQNRSEQRTTPLISPGSAEPTKSDPLFSLSDPQKLTATEDPMPHPWEDRAEVVKAQLEHRQTAGDHHEPANCPTCQTAKANFDAATAKSGYLSPAAALYLARCRDKLLAQRGADNGNEPA